jgi:23S rRNA pseudouridine1911/1915/1917 synthase
VDEKMENGLGVEAGQAGERLDRFVSREAGVGLRAARRMAEGGHALVDGARRLPGYKLRPGQVVTLAGRDGPSSAPGKGEPAGDARPVPDGEPSSARGGAACAPRLVSANDQYAAFFKPAGLHTVSLAGGGGLSLEDALPGLCPGRPVLLVNRLDRDTSGIVLGAFDERSARRFRELEDGGMVDKRYLALALGDISGPLVLKWGLDTHDRARVKVLGSQTPDGLRWTRVRPLARAGGLTLVEARIAKGARHQIRAHLARAGFPIAGDALYGVVQKAGLKLHHWCARFPGFQAGLLPAWAEFATECELFMEECPCAPW